MPTFGSLFAGIGGIDLGLERAGWECRFQVEWDEFCQRVLAKHWPDVPRFGDIHDVHGRAECPTLADPDSEARASTWAAGQAVLEPGSVERSGRRGGCAGCLPEVDLLAGGFPCQPFSVAGKQRRLEDDRWLWPEFARAIRELRPRYVLVENVPGLLVGGGMDAVLGDLAELGYDAEWESIPAAAVGAPHLRYRVWIVAYARRRSVRTDGGRGQAHGPSGTPEVQEDQWERGGHPAGGGGSEAGTLADSDLTGSQGHGRLHPERDGAGEWLAWTGGGSVDGWWSVEPDVGRVAHGVPARVDRLRSLGNAVVPQVVEVIGRAIRADMDNDPH